MTIEIECDDCDFRRELIARLETGGDITAAVIVMRHAAETGHRGFGILVLGDTGHERAMGRPAPPAGAAPGRLPL